MWIYNNYSVDEKNPAGITVVRVYMHNATRDECFFLEYTTLPENSVIITHAQSIIDGKNLVEQKNQEEVPPVE